MDRRRRRCRHLLWIAALLAIPVFAREGSAPPEIDGGVPASTFFESVDVDVVNVEVYVTDRDGNPVRGLARDDFELLVDGERQEITNFYAASEPGAAFATARADVSTSTGEASATEPATSGTAPESPAAQTLHLVIFVDNENLTPVDRNQVIRELQDSLADDLGAADRVTLVSYDGSVNLRSLPSNEVDTLVATLEEMAGTVASGVHDQLDRVDILRLLQQTDLEGNIGGGRRPAVGAGPDFQTILRQLETFAEGQYQKVERTVGTLRQFVDSLAGLSGRKALLYVSNGPSLHPAEALFRAFERKAPGLVDPSDYRQYDANHLFERLGRDANAARVTFYTVLAAGRGTQTLTPAERGAFASGSAATLGQVWSEDLDTLDRSNSRGSLQVLAASTGGRATLAANHFDAALTELRRDMTSYYSLGFSAGTLRGEDQDVEVRVSGGDYRVRHRETVRRQTPDQAMEAATRAALVFAESGNSLGVRVETGEPKEAKKGRLLVPVLVKFPIARLVLVPGESFHEGKVTVYVAARDAAGRMSPVQKLPAPVRVPNEKLLTAMGQVAGYRVGLVLEPGEQTVAVTVRDEVANTSSTALHRFDPRSPGAR